MKLLASEAVADKQTKRPGCGRGRGAAFCDMAFICRQCITAGIRGIHQQAVYYVMPYHDDHIACIEPRGIEGGNKSLFARHRRASVVVQGRTANEIGLSMSGLVAQCNQRSVLRFETVAFSAEERSLIFRLFSMRRGPGSCQ